MPNARWCIGFSWNDEAWWGFALHDYFPVGLVNLFGGLQTCQQFWPGWSTLSQHGVHFYYWWWRWRRLVTLFWVFLTVCLLNDIFMQNVIFCSNSVQNSMKFAVCHNVWLLCQLKCACKRTSKQSVNIHQTTVGTAVMDRFGSVFKADTDVSRNQTQVSLIQRSQIWFYQKKNSS